MPEAIPRNPYPCVDIIIYDVKLGIVLIKRKNPPFGWALPGGFIDYGESAENAAVREAMEETSLKVTLKSLHGVYSAPGRDPRFHTLSICYLGQASNLKDIKGRDDATEATFFPLDKLPNNMAFDHRAIIQDFIEKINKGALP